jgi:protein gp37
LTTKTSIEWTDVSWNPARGCSVVSPGCKNCYAMKVAARFSKEGQAFDGFATMVDGKAKWTGKVSLVRGDFTWPSDDLRAPLHWRTPRRCFVNSMSDLFHENLSEDDILKVIGVIAIDTLRENGSGSTYQILTKRAERMRAIMTRDVRWIRERIARLSAPLMEDGDGWFDELAFRMPWPLPSIELLVSVENQEYADLRIPELLACPAAVRGVSYEPALGPVAFDKIIGVEGGRLRRLWSCPACEGTGYRDARKLSGACDACASTVPAERGSGVGIDWIIVGGESGPGARDFNPEWARSVLDQAGAVPVRPPAIFVKQMGRVWSKSHGFLRLDPKGSDARHHPLDLRVRQYPRPRTRREPYAEVG